MAVAELESAVIGEQVAVGMARAKAQGHSRGRKPLNIPVINVCDALQAYSSIAAAARELKCSRGTFTKSLRGMGLHRQMSLMVDDSRLGKKAVFLGCHKGSLL